MKTVSLISSLVVTFSAVATAATGNRSTTAAPPVASPAARTGAMIEISPGQSHRAQEGDVVTCRDTETVCTIDRSYTATKYKLTMPNRKTYFESEEKSEVMAKARELIDTKVCERLQIETEK